MRIIAKKCNNCDSVYTYEIKENTDFVECKKCKNKISLKLKNEKLINLNGYSDSLGIYFKSPLSRR